MTRGILEVSSSASTLSLSEGRESDRDKPTGIECVWSTSKSIAAPSFNADGPCVPASASASASSG
jgi:hypothetical protein